LDGWTVGRSDSWTVRQSDGETEMPVSKDRVARYEDLEVYKLAVGLQQKVFDVSMQWPRSEQYSLTDQVRRSSRAIGANIAEAWAKRRYQAHFISKLTDADGEQNETRHWLRTALACEYLDAQATDELERICTRIGAMLGSMIAGADSWVKQ